MAWFGDNLWAIMVVGMPLILGVAIIWALLRNRKVTPREHARTEAATRDLYKDLNDEQQARESRSN